MHAFVRGLLAQRTRLGAGAVRRELVARRCEWEGRRARDERAGGDVLWMEKELGPPAQQWGTATHAGVGPQSGAGDLEESPMWAGGVPSAARVRVREDRRERSGGTIGDGRRVSAGGLRVADAKAASRKPSSVAMQTSELLAHEVGLGGSQPKISGCTHK